MLRNKREKEKDVFERDVTETLELLDWG